ncbi:hypothetical protein rsdtw13_04030 [Clostridium sp. TW13]|uniref:Uncharacterized protein n=1 Tax=Inconstantimicrobium mannanitabidum TaxID=1604901 RepID=A0ACB5R7H7_9CLOT|nr:hypothetical protein rsdtw13_04030 [Clostridium sp. TW13]
MHIELFHQNVGGCFNKNRQKSLKTSYDNSTKFYQHLSGIVTYRFKKIDIAYSWPTKVYIVMLKITYKINHQKKLTSLQNGHIIKEQ